MSASVTPTKVPIRYNRATDADAPALLAFIEALNSEEDLPPTGKAPADLVQALGYRGDMMFAFLARADSNPVGYVLAHDAFTSEVLEWGVFVVDLYVSPDFRKLGIASGLIDCVAMEAKQRNATHLWWASMADNTEAQTAYARIGAKADQAVAHALTTDTFEKAAKRGMVHLNIDFTEADTG